MSNKPNSNEVDIDIIVREVVEMVIDGHQRADINTFIKKKHKKGIRQIDRYLKKAKEYIKEISKESDSEMISRAKLRIDKIYQKSLKAGEFKNALSAIREMSNLFGLHAPKKIQHLGDEENPLFNIPAPTRKELDHVLADMNKTHAPKRKKTSK